ncbi:MAG: PAS domain S-box protein [Polyangiales bacterium]
MDESSFRAALEAAPDAMIIVDREGTMVLVNSQTERLFGYSRQELIGQKVEMLVPAQFRARHATHRAGYLADAQVREMGSDLELFARRKDGTEFPAEISLSPLQTEQGVRVISAIRDVTERREAQQKTLLLKEIHHRVKNNLQIISSLLRLHGERTQSAEARAALDDAQQRVRAIALLHERLHDLKVSGAFEFDTYARSIIASIAHVSGIELEDQISPVQLSLDEALPLGLILNELVTNALKHAFSARGDAAQARRVTVSVRRQGDNVELEVRDNGCGFDGQEREGALGLQLVRTLARQLRGEVSFASDAGARVRVTFPHREPRSAA